MKKEMIRHEVMDYLTMTFGLLLFAFGWVAFFHEHAHGGVYAA